MTRSYRNLRHDLMKAYHLTFRYGLVFAIPIRLELFRFLSISARNPGVTIEPFIELYYISYKTLLYTPVVPYVGCQRCNLYNIQVSWSINSSMESIVSRRCAQEYC